MTGGWRGRAAGTLRATLDGARGRAPRLGPMLGGGRRLLGGAAVAALLAGPSAAETLTDALIGAYQTSGLLQQNRALLRAADEDVAIAISALYPVINWSLSTDFSVNRIDVPGRNQIDPSTGAPVIDPGTGRAVRIAGGRQTSSETSAVLGLTAQLTLYDGGQNRLAIDAAKEAVLATRESLRDVEQQVLLRAVVAFFSVLADEELVRLSQNNVRLIQEELRAARDRFEVGEITRTDVSLAEAALAESRGLLASAEGDVAVSREEYLLVVGRYPGDLVQPPRMSSPAASVEAARAVGVRRHPAIAEAQRNVTVSEVNIERAHAERRPNLSLGGRLSVRDRFDRADSLSLELSGPIYQGGRLDAIYRQAVARAEAARAVLLITVEEVRQDVANAFSNLLVAQARLQANQEQVQAQEVAFEGTREEATLGARTTLDVLEAEQDLLDARTNVVVASTNQFIATYQLLASMGLLTVDELNLGITQYDPLAYYKAVEDAPVLSPQGRRLDRLLKSLGD